MRAVILHATDGSPTNVKWEAWLQHELKKRGYTVWFPQLPNSHTPNVSTYDAFFAEAGWDFADNIIVGHSSGSTTLLHLLNKPDFPKIQAAVLVGTFLNERLLESAEWYEPGQFDGLFVEEFDLERIKQKADKFYFVHGTDDPYCDYEEVEKMCEQLGGIFIPIQNGHHLGESSLVHELPDLLNAMERFRSI